MYNLAHQEDGLATVGGKASANPWNPTAGTPTLA